MRSVLESTYGDRLHPDADEHASATGRGGEAHDRARRSTARAGVRGRTRAGAGRDAARADAGQGVFPTCRSSSTARWPREATRDASQPPELLRRRDAQRASTVRTARRSGSAGCATPPRADESRALNDRKEPVHHHLGIRHVRGRPHPPPPAPRARRRAQHRAVRRLSRRRARSAVGSATAPRS